MNRQPNKNGDVLPPVPEKFEPMKHENKERETTLVREFEDCEMWEYLGEQFGAIVSGDEPTVYGSMEKWIQALLATVEPVALENGNTEAIYLRSALGLLEWKALDSPIHFLRAVRQSIAYRRRLAEEGCKAPVADADSLVADADSLVAVCLLEARAAIRGVPFLKARVEQQLAQLQPKPEKATEAASPEAEEKDDLQRAIREGLGVSDAHVQAATYLTADAVRMMEKTVLLAEKEELERMQKELAGHLGLPTSYLPLFSEIPRLGKVPPPSPETLAMIDRIKEVLDKAQPALAQACVERIKERMQVHDAVLKEFFDALAQVQKRKARPEVATLTDEDVTAAAAAVEEADKVVAISFEEDADGNPEEESGEESESGSLSSYEHDTLMERWVVSDRTPPAPASYVPTVLVYESVATGRLPPAFVHALEKHFKHAGYRLFLLPAPDRVARESCNQTMQNTYDAFSAQLTGDITVVLHIAISDPRTTNLPPVSRHFLRNLPHKGRGCLNVVHLEAGNLPYPNDLPLLGAGTWTLNADEAAYLFLSLQHLHDAAWKGATDEQQRGWPTKRPIFGMFPVTSRSTLLPVAATFPEDRKAYSVEKVENLARFFRNLGIELVPVASARGLGGRNVGEAAAILVPHYTERVPLLEVRTINEYTRPATSPLSWMVTPYHVNNTKQMRDVNLSAFLETVRALLRPVSPHYAARDTFRIEVPKEQP